MIFNNITNIQHLPVDPFAVQTLTLLSWTHHRPPNIRASIHIYRCHRKTVPSDALSVLRLWSVRQSPRCPAIWLPFPVRQKQNHRPHKLCVSTTTTTKKREYNKAKYYANSTHSQKDVPTRIKAGRINPSAFRFAAIDQNTAGKSWYCALHHFCVFFVARQCVHDDEIDGWLGWSTDLEKQIYRNSCLVNEYMCKYYWWYIDCIFIIVKFALTMRFRLPT